MERLNILNTICKKIENNFLLDLLFPRFCLCCKEPGMEKWFCAPCWDLLALPDPAHRCRHCFTPVEGLLCLTCLKTPLLCFPRVLLFDCSPPASILRQNMDDAEEALSAMALIFWHRLTYDLPHAVFELPDEKGKKSIARVAKKFAELLNVPYVQGLKRTYAEFLKPDLALSSSRLRSDQTLVLFDGASSLAWLQKACAAISDAFPKRVLIFSLFEG
jgi:hypothetical protein